MDFFAIFQAGFALKLFQRCLKMNKIGLNIETKEARSQSSEIVEPIVGQILFFMTSSSSDLMQSSLECIGFIINWPLYCIRKNNRKMLKQILKVIETNDINDLGIIQSCFKMIRRILQANRYFLSPSQLTEVLQFTKEYLYPAEWVNEPLQCLSVISH
jgi:hypothetical protein